MGLESATAFVTRYTGTPSEHWAYPAYDAYPGGDGSRLSEPDLLAPILLNVPRISLRTYDELRAGLPEINALLCVPELDVSLVDASQGTIDALVALFALLDEPGFHGVRLTTWTKLLHRKRPQTIPLFDEHIRRCYQVLGWPVRVPSVTGRGRAGFARAWLPEVQSDLVTQRDHWEALARIAPGPAITPLRALDMVGWALGDPKRQWLTDEDAPGRGHLGS